MSYSSKQVMYVDLPEWSDKLKQYYWIIRVESRNKVKRRRYYRYVAKEKLRLVELGIDQELLNAVCRYLCDYKAVSGRNLEQVIANPPAQMSLELVFI